QSRGRSVRHIICRGRRLCPAYGGTSGVQSDQADPCYVSVTRLDLVDAPPSASSCSCTPRSAPRRFADNGDFPSGVLSSATLFRIAWTGSSDLSPRVSTDFLVSRAQSFTPLQSM